MLTPLDRLLLAQLPDECVIEIYKNFLYKDFLFKFRRLFNLSDISKFYGFMLKKTDDRIVYNGASRYSKKNLQNLEWGTIPYPYYTFDS